MTGDIEAVQNFITSALLGILVDVFTLVGMIGVMFWINWRFSLIALSTTPILMLVVYSFTHRIKKASRAVRKKQGELVSVVQEVLHLSASSRLLPARTMNRSVLKQRAWKMLRPRWRPEPLRPKLAPLVEVVAAIGTCLVLVSAAAWPEGPNPSRHTCIIHFLPGRNVQADARPFQDDGYGVQSHGWI